MFNPEKLLGGLLQSGMRRKQGGLGSLVSGGAALGMLGIAWEAVEHYMNKSQGVAGSAGPPPMPPQTRMGAPSAPPPPPPGLNVSSPAPIAPGNQRVAISPADSERQNHALLLIQAMIAAANADGTIDARERATILDRLKSVQLSEEEHQFIVHELLDPKPLQAIVDQITSEALGRQVYLASLLAIEVDTDEEIDYLKNMAQALHLNQETLKALHLQAGVEIVF